MILDTPEAALDFALRVAPQLLPYEAQLLSGGYCNYVYRLLCREGPSVILKSYPPYLAANPGMAFSTTRHVMGHVMGRVIRHVMGMRAFDGAGCHTGQRPVIPAAGPVPLRDSVSCANSQR